MLVVSRASPLCTHRACFLRKCVTGPTECALFLWPSHRQACWSVIRHARDALPRFPGESGAYPAHGSLLVSRSESLTRHSDVSSAPPFDWHLSLSRAESGSRTTAAPDSTPGETIEPRYLIESKPDHHRGGPFSYIVNSENTVPDREGPARSSRRSRLLFPLRCLFVGRSPVQSDFSHKTPGEWAEV